MLSTTISAISIITKEQLAKATALHTKYMLGAGILLVFLVIIGTVINTIAPFSGWNAIIAMLLGLLAIFLITKPTALAIIFLATSIGGLPNLEIGKIFREGLGGLPDFKSKDVFVAGISGIEKWFNISGYIILSMMLFHLVLEFVPFHGEIMLVFTVLAILEGLAIREYLYYKETASKHYKKWTLYLLLMALLISVIRVASLSISGEDIRKTVTAIPSYVTRGEEDWVPVSMVTTCAPVWNEKQGWCDLGTFPAGTYRVVPQFDTWQVKVAPSNPPRPTDIDFYPVPPEGFDAKTYFQNNEMVGDFLKTAFVKSYRYGALIVKVGTSLPTEVIGNDGLPRELVVLEKQSKMSINVNLPKFPERFTGNQGNLTVEVQKLSP